MNPLTLITKGYLSAQVEEVNNYYFPFSITVDYGAKQVDVLVEDETLDVVVEQETLNVEAGQKNIDITLDQSDIIVED